MVTHLTFPEAVALLLLVFAFAGIAAILSVWTIWIVRWWRLQVRRWQIRRVAMDQTTTDDFERFLRDQRTRIARRLSTSDRRVRQAREAAKNPDVMGDALVVTVRGTGGGAPSRRQDS